jgi:hypothetical protein
VKRRPKPAPQRNFFGADLKSVQVEDERGGDQKRDGIREPDHFRQEQKQESVDVLPLRVRKENKSGSQCEPALLVASAG